MPLLTSQRRARATDAVVIVVAWNFAIAQPLLDGLGRNPEFFVAHSATGLDILTIAIGLTIVAPLLLAGIITLVAAINTLAGRVLHRITLAALLAELGLQLLKNLAGDAPTLIQLLIPTALGIGAAWLYDRRANLRGLTWWFLPAPFIFLALFLTSPVNGLIFTTNVTSDTDVTIATPRPVILIVFDELPVVSLMRPDGALDRAAYPNFARLADRSTWYPNTTADWSLTEKSVPTILTGKIDTGRVPTASENPKNLFTMLGGAYTIDAWEPITKLCPDSLCGDANAGLTTTDRIDTLIDDTQIVAGHILLPDPLTQHLPAIDQSWGHFGQNTTDTSGDTNRDGAKGGDRTSGAEARRAGAGHQATLAALDPPAALDDLAAGLRPGKPTLTVMHVLIPHIPWQYLPDGTRYANGNQIPGLASGRGNRRWADDPQLTTLARSRHLLQLQYTDSLLGTILDRLDATTLGQEAVVVVTADHGVAFEAGDWPRIPHPAIRGDIAFVPLFVSVPGRPAGTDDRPAQLADVVPTIADALDAEAPGWEFDGVSLIGTEGGDSSPRVLRTPKLDDVAVGPGTEARDDALARKWRHYRATTLSDAEVLYATGPLAELVGRPAPAAAPLDGAAVELGQRGLLAASGPGSSIQPALLLGTTRAVPDDRDLAVALNGTVAGVGRTYDDGRITALVSPKYLRSGSNAVTILMATESGYRSISLDGAISWALERDSTGNAVLAGSDGTKATITPDAFRGHVDSHREGSFEAIDGWAVANSASTTPVTIVMLRNNRYLASTVTGIERVDLARANGDDRDLRSGFSVQLPSDEVGNPDRSAIAVYAVIGNTATELSYTSTYRYPPRPLAGATLARENGRTVIRTTDGRTIRIVGAPARGALDRSATGVSGWAATGNQPFAGWIAVFVDGSAVWIGTTGVERPDVARTLKEPALEHSGFAATIPNAASSTVRVFAIDGGVAREMPSSGGEG